MALNASYEVPTRHPRRSIPRISVSKYCIKQARCMLCRFSFVDHEPIVARIGRDDVPATFTTPFPFRLGKTHRYRPPPGGGGDVFVHMCCRVACDIDGIVYAGGLHPGCNAVATALYGSVSRAAFTREGKYMFAPSPAEEQQRARAIQRALVPRLAAAQQHIQEEAAQLPAELWAMVAELLTRESAAVTTQELALQGRPWTMGFVSDFEMVTVDLTKPVYASFTAVDGQFHYVQRLYNDTPPREGIAEDDLPTEKKMERMLLFPGFSRPPVVASSATTTAATTMITTTTATPCPSRRVTLLVASDYQGIRRLVFVLEEQEAAWCARHLQDVGEVPGLWWRRFSHYLLARTSTVTALYQRDMPQLCDIKSPDRDFKAHVYWPLPSTAAPRGPALIDLETLSRPLRISGSEFRMRYVELNGGGGRTTPTTTGYSVATDGRLLFSIIAHRQGEGERDHAGDYVHVGGGVEREYVWVYMPIGAGEFLTAVSRRLCHAGPPPGFNITGRRSRKISLILSTNCGRHHEFGGYWSPNPAHVVNVRRIASLTGDAPCRMYFNDANASAVRQQEMCVLAFERSSGGGGIVGSIGDDGDDSDGGNDVDTNNRGYAAGIPLIIDRPILRHPFDSSTTSFPTPIMYSACSLDGVAAIRPCIQSTVPHRPVVGLLVSYADGTRPDACIGQWRFDWAAEKLIVLGQSNYGGGEGRGGGGGLHIGQLRITADVDDGRPERVGESYVCAVAVHPPAAGQPAGTDRQVEWTKVGWQGTLEWWFTAQRSVLFHNGEHLAG